jgi:hypothetical protein
MVRTFLKVSMELGFYFLFLQEQIKDIIIMAKLKNFPVQRGNSGREAKGQWSPKGKARIREQEAELIWAKRSAGTWAEKFHNREGAGRKELGEAIQLAHLAKLLARFRCHPVGGNVLQVLQLIQAFLQHLHAEYGLYATQPEAATMPGLTQLTRL